MMSGDIQVNPGPNWKYPCLLCSKPVKINQQGICCDYCNLWSHLKCIGMTTAEYNVYQNDEGLTWSCQMCLFPYTDSFLTDGDVSLPVNSATRSDVSFDVPPSDVSFDVPPVNFPMKVMTERPLLEITVQLRLMTMS